MNTSLCSTRSHSRRRRWSTFTVTCRYRAKDTLRVERHGEHWRFYIESPAGAAGVIMDTDTMRRLFGELLREAEREREVE